MRGIPFEITEADLVIPDVCPVFKTPFCLDGHGRQPNSPSLDRIDNSKGYTKDNIRVVSWKVNSLKSNATADELIKVVLYMVTHEQEQQQVRRK